MQSSHAEFGQPGGYSQQYPYQQALSSVQGSHDMGKQVAAGQPGMFSNAGGMQSAAQQHHPSMAPVQSPQSASLVQQGPQINRGNHIQAMQAFYPVRPTNGPRQMANISRTPAAVNQTGQQPNQYPMQMLQHFQPQHIQHMMLNQFQYHAQRPSLHHAPQYSMLQQPVYVNSQWNNTYPQPPPNSNGFYQQQIYNNPMPPQLPQMPPAQQPPQQQQAQIHTARKKQILSIVDPLTGINIMDTIDSEPPPMGKETENADPNICAQFATQVAATLGVKNETLSKSIEVSRIMETETVLCPEMASLCNIDEIQLNEMRDIESLSKHDIESMGDLADAESLADVEYNDNRSLPCSDDSAPIYSKDSDLINSINDRVYEVAKYPVDPVPHMVETQDFPKYEMVVENASQSAIEEYVTTDTIEADTIDANTIEAETIETVCSLTPDQAPVYYESSELKDNVQLVEEQDSSVVVPEETQPEVSPINLITEEIKSTEPEVSEVSSASSKIPDKLIADDLDFPGKKGKTKKKKDLNKRGETKEGGEMDAFLLAGEESSVPPPIPAVVPVPPPQPVERIPSPVPITDTEELKKIPMPPEPFPPDFQQTDTSPSEPPSEASVSPSAENEEKENTDDTKVVLKYSYKEDQWSPLNPEGKKQYDRDFLIQMQSQPMSLCKPSNLPNLDVIKDKAHIQRLTEVNRVIQQVVPPTRAYNDTFLPMYARGGAPRLPHPASLNRRSQQPRGGEKTPRKIIFTSLTKDVKLHESENAWKPLCKTDGPSDVDDIEMERTKLKRNVQGVLNKLTPQKFETLLLQLKNLNIDTEDKLNIVIDLIFEKAIDEPNFSVPYANLCKHLAMIKVPLVGQAAGQCVNFRKLLLIKCQKEFEQDRTDEIKNEERLKAIQAAEGTKKKELQLEFDAEEKKTRYRQLGNIRFIGELFKLNMLIEPIMHECIKRLLTQADEESLECLCKLLKTIGKELDDSKTSKNRDQPTVMDSYFNEMQRYVDKRLTSSRVRFMLQDVIDLKKCYWVPRRDENNPKTIDQIHKEAEREAREQQQNLQNMNNYQKRMPDDRDRRKNTGRNLGTSEDGWTSSTKSNKGSYSVVDPTKLKLTKPDEVESIRLGPSGRGISSWGRGSSGGTKNAPESEKTVTNNRFNILADTPATSGYEGRRGSQRSAASSRESSRGRNSGQLQPSAIRKTSSTSKERENLLETVKGFARSTGTIEPKAQETKRTPDVQLNGKATESIELGLRGQDLSEEELDKKTKPLIDEFLHNNNDFEEAIKCVMELVSPTTVQFFINSAINQVLERSSQARYSLGQLLYSLVKKKIITLDQYKKGFSIVLECIDDFALDIPLIWEYIGEILEPMLEDSEFPLPFLKDILLPCIPSETAGLLVSAVLHCAAKKKGTIKLGEVWRDSGLQWMHFLGPNANVNDFIQKQKLEFTISPTKVKPSSQISSQEVKKHLISLLEKTEENEEIFDWIDANVSENTDSLFIRALVSAVHENVITGTDSRFELDQIKLKKRIPLLSRYIGKNENSELQALYAIQALMHDLEQPKGREKLNGFTAEQINEESIYDSGILRNIFDILYDDDVINEETFKTWEQSEDPAEIEGKGEALHSVKSFFTWLRETEDEEPAD